MNRFKTITPLTLREDPVRERPCTFWAACDLEEAFRSDRKVESSVYYTVLLTLNRLFRT